MMATCDIIRDMADVYYSGKSSDDTRQAVETHLESCESCREYFQRIQESKKPYLRVITSGADTELVEKNLKRLFRRLEIKQAISTVCAAATAVIGISALLHDVLKKHQSL